ncbi:MAG: universal stress protein, partial [Ilumatobacteraceae bacterium]
MSQHFDTLDPVFVPGPGGKVIVGYDGSPTSVAALDWGAAEALVRSSVLHAMMCSTPSDATDFYEAGARRRGELHAAVVDLTMRFPGLHVESTATIGDPRDALSEHAEPADLLVVGASTGGVVKRLLLGSVPRDAARRSPCPVVVVHGRTTTKPDRHTIDRIVVGIDGSIAADTAIQWTCSESGFHGADIVLVHAWERGSREEAQVLLDRAVERCRHLTPNPVEGRLVAGSPTDALVAASRDADLVAIGSRGRSGFATMLFGSVALAVAELAACPIAITHPQRHLASGDHKSSHPSPQTPSPTSPHPKGQHS